mmetsp:Transcript_17203/g.35748  ORF Transcript_17203/g.35748 Transcript_17203/m.35748 type:complete len:99 (-) Transcript_17203:2359-2655(-)
MNVPSSLSKGTDVTSRVGAHMLQVMRDPEDARLKLDKKRKIGDVENSGYGSLAQKRPTEGSNDHGRRASACRKRSPRPPSLTEPLRNVGRRLGLPTTL